MRKKSKTATLVITGIALAIGIAVSSGIIRNTYSVNEARAETATITINQASFGTNITTSYNDGEEKTGTANDLDIAAKAVMKNSTNIQMQASNGVIYNTEALSGKILSVSMTLSGTSRNHTLYAGSTERLVNSTKANYTVTGGTSLSSTFTSSYTMAEGTNYTWFAVKNTSGNAAYITSLVVTYQQTPPRTLTGIIVSGEPTKKVYDSGDSFEPAGITITASFSDSDDDDVTNLCTYTPDPLIQGTESVVVSFAEGEVTKTATISGITVNAAPLTRVVGFGSGAEDNGWQEVTNNTQATYIGFATTSHSVTTSFTNLVGTGYVLDSNITVTFKVGTYGGTGKQGTLAVALLDASQNVLSSGTGDTILTSSAPNYAQGPSISVAKPANPANINSIKIYLSSAGTFTTEIYMRFSEITIVYQMALSLEENDDAIAYGTSFLSATNAGCSATNSGLLLDVWADLESSYNALSTEAKTYLTNLTPDKDGNDAENAVARYIIIITKYGTDDFPDFMNLDIQQVYSPYSLIGNDIDYLPLVIIISVVGLTVIISYYYFNKKRRSN